jgi:hypothetical protein
MGGQPDLSQIISMARFSENCFHAQGPGFSGLLAFPLRGEVEWEYRKTYGADAAAVRAAVRPHTGERLWQSLRGMWRGAPMAARGLALAVPLMAPALFFAPKASFEIHSPAPGGLTAAIQARATVDLQESFQSGLDAWTGQLGWQRTWSVDGSGSAQPGKLALYRPSIPLSDYRLEFQGQIEAKAMGFVFRAADENNYQAVKLTIRKAGPQQSVALVRYTVIGGVEGPRMEFPLAQDLHSDTLYRLLVEAQGPHFTVTVNRQFADAWSDERLKAGGVGFFAEKGEISHIRSVHVVDKQDFLGWLCSQVSLWTADRPAMGVRHE